MSSHAPTTTPAVGSSQYRSSKVPLRQSPGKSARRHVTAPPRRALRANAYRHTAAAANATTRLTPSVHRSSGAEVSPHPQALMPKMPKLTGSAAASARGPFAPAMRLNRNPGSRKNGTANHAAATGVIVPPRSDTSLAF
ncbi:hypothetical protein COGO111638_09170 [Corynebacterium gottingense]